MGRLHLCVEFRLDDSVLVAAAAAAQPALLVVFLPGGFGAKRVCETGADSAWKLWRAILLPKQPA